MTISNSQELWLRFSLQKSTPLNMWVMMVYIVWVKTQWSRYAKIAKQNVSRVSRGKALPVKYSRKPAIMTLCFPIMCCAHGFTSREVFQQDTRENSFNLQCCLESLHSLSHTTHTMKSHTKYRIHKIEQNYNQIWHGIKANTKQL